jgi:hypothetical protein
LSPTFTTPITPDAAYLKRRWSGLRDDATNSEIGDAYRLACADTVFRLLAEHDPERYGDLLKQIGT